MRIAVMLATLCLSGLVVPPIAPACVVVGSPTVVAPNFQVKVSGSDGPVKGLLLHLTSSDRSVQEAVTDEAGVAKFHDAPTGTLYVQAEPDHGFGPELNVKPSGPANVTVSMGWPSVEPIRVHSLSGAMRAPDAIPGSLDQTILSLDLLDGIAGRVVFSQNTTQRGEFDFGNRAPGLYFIRLNPYSAFHMKFPVEGLISVVLDPNAPERADKLDLNLNWTSCGLMYRDPIQCHQFTLRVRQLKGHVGNSSDEPMPQAEVILLDGSKSQVARLTTDDNGDFSLPGSPSGAFELRIRGGAFTPVHAPIRIDPTASDVALEIDGHSSFGCSTIQYRCPFALCGCPKRNQAKEFSPTRLHPH